MKKRFNFYILLSLFFALTLTVSCSKKDDDTPAPSNTGGVVGNNSTLTVTPDNSLTKKWIVTALNKRASKTADGASEYSWFEFSPYGLYIIMKTDGTVIDGTYSYDEVNNIIILDGFGEIQITGISSSEFTFTIIPSGESEIEVTTTSGVSDENAKTLQFARVWNLTKQTEAGVETNIFSLVDSAYAVVTKYGTHMLVLKGGTLGDMYIPQTWKWSDATQASICVGDTEPDCNADKLTVTLTSDNKLIIEYQGEEPGTVTREEFEELILK